jgi:hypothetical protein
MSISKVGRNDPCHCGSGKKYKKCHGAPQNQPDAKKQGPFILKELDMATLPPEIKAMHERFCLEDQKRESEFGKVRLPISLEFQGQRLVVSGNKLFYQPAEKTKYFTDFLLTIVPSIFGKEWFDYEIAKPFGQRHPAMESRVRAMKYMNDQIPTAEGIYSAVITGRMLEYFVFAYDLFVVQDNGRLDARLVDRLRNCEQYQGARHELFAEATCLKAGFEIEHENETDGTTKHAEFTATHKLSGQKVSVEAKSKHRPGILGRPGEREEIGNHDIRLGKLLRNAVAKNSPHPLVVFLDLNLPRSSADRLIGTVPPHPFIVKTIDRLREEHGGKDPINLLVLTNQPQHYVKDEEIAQQPNLLTILFRTPERIVIHNDSLMDIHKAANLYGKFPQYWPKGK